MLKSCGLGLKQTRRASYAVSSDEQVVNRTKQRTSLPKIRKQVSIVERELHDSGKGGGIESKGNKESDKFADDPSEEQVVNRHARRRTTSVGLSTSTSQCCGNITARRTILLLGRKQYAADGGHELQGKLRSAFQAIHRAVTQVSLMRRAVVAFGEVAEERRAFRIAREREKEEAREFTRLKYLGKSESLESGRAVHDALQLIERAMIVLDQSEARGALEEVVAFINKYLDQMGRLRESSAALLSILESMGDAYGDQVNESKRINDRVLESFAQLRKILETMRAENDATKSAESVQEHTSDVELDEDNREDDEAALAKAAPHVWRDAPAHCLYALDLLVAKKTPPRNMFPEDAESPPESPVPAASLCPPHRAECSEGLLGIALHGNRSGTEVAELGDPSSSSSSATAAISVEALANLLPSSSSANGASCLDSDGPTTVLFESPTMIRSPPSSYDTVEEYASQSARRTRKPFRRTNVQSERQLEKITRAFENSRSDKLEHEPPDSSRKCSSSLLWKCAPPEHGPDRSPKSPTVPATSPLPHLDPPTPKSSTDPSLPFVTWNSEDSTMSQTFQWGPMEQPCRPEVSLGRSGSRTFRRRPPCIDTGSYNASVRRTLLRAAPSPRASDAQQRPDQGEQLSINRLAWLDNCAQISEDSHRESRMRATSSNAGAVNKTKLRSPTFCKKDNGARRWQRMEIRDHIHESNLHESAASVAKALGPQSSANPTSGKSPWATILQEPAVQGTKARWPQMKDLSSAEWKLLGDVLSECDL